MIINLPKEKQPSIEHHVEVMVAGAAPPVAVIEGMRNIGINVNHVYGLTETYGPSALCASQAGWATSPLPSKRNYTLVRVYLILYKIVCEC